MKINQRKLLLFFHICLHLTAPSKWTAGTMAYLSELHPEVYVASPRAGGLANIVPDAIPGGPRQSIVSGKGSRSTIRSEGRKNSGLRRSSMRSYRSSISSGRSSLRSSIFDDNIFTSTPVALSREYRINKVLNTTQWELSEDDIFDEDANPLPDYDPVNNVKMILSIVISTIMLMAVDHKDISKDHLRWTLSYLGCIKDEFGNVPPNVRGILNNIRTIDDTLESFLESEILPEGTLDAGTDPALINEPDEKVVAETDG